MKKLLFLVVLLVAGLALGGGAAFATMRMLGAPHAGQAGAAGGSGDAGAAEVDTTPAHFVPTGKILAPLVFDDGRLAGYALFEVQLEVDEDKTEFVTARMPLLLHAVNMRTYRTPMAAGPNGMLPNLDTFRKVVEQAAPEAFGAGVVRKVAVTSAAPA